LGNIGGVLALANMASTWKNDFVSWGGFLRSVFDTYRAILHPMVPSNQIEPTATFVPRVDENTLFSINPPRLIRWILLGGRLQTDN
jgi:hypothetical protein